jgi:hypothetical protein
MLEGGSPDRDLSNAHLSSRSSAAISVSLFDAWRNTHACTAVGVVVVGGGGGGSSEGWVPLLADRAGAAFEEKAETAIGIDKVIVAAKTSEVQDKTRGSTAMVSS